MSNQSGVQQAVREATGTAHSYQGDWHALFDDDGIPVGAWNERMLAWINQTLGEAYANLPGAMQAFAEIQGFTSWSGMDTLSLSSAALEAAGDEAQILVLDFTDTGTRGHPGSAFVRNDSASEHALFGETNGLAIDFTDSHFVSDGHYGSAVIKET